MKRSALLVVVVAGCQPSEPAKDPQQAQYERYERESRCRNALHWLAEDNDAEWRKDRCDELPALAELATKARAKSSGAGRPADTTAPEQVSIAALGPCEGAHMGVNDTWVGGRRRRPDGMIETCTPNEAEIAAMPESTRKPLTEAQKQAIRKRGREHYDEVRDQLDAEAARRAQQGPKPGQPVRVEVTGVK